MPYVNKERKTEDFTINEAVATFYDGCLIKENDNVKIPVTGGLVQIFKPVFLGHGTVIQASISPSDRQLIDFFGKSVAKYRERWKQQEISLNDIGGRKYSDESLARDSLALYFEKKIDGAEFLGDKTDTPVTIPLTVQIYPGRLEKDNEDFIIEKGIFNIRRYKDGKGGAVEDVRKNESDKYKDNKDFPAVFVREVIFNSEKMEKLNSKYLVRKGIDDDLHNRNLMIAETAKRELGFNYKERKGDCLSQVCISPEELTQKKLPAKVLKETKKDSFKEMVLNLSQRDKYNSITTRMDIEVSQEADGRNLLKMEAENSHDQPEYARELFKEFFGFINPEMPEGSTISFLEYEDPGAIKHLKKAGKIAKKVIPYVIGVGILYEGGKAAAPHIYDIAVLGGKAAVAVGGLYLTYRGLKYVAGKTKDNPVIHPIKTAQKKRAEEVSLVIDHLKSYDIRTNITRSGSCMVQIDSKKCAEIERAKKEKAVCD